MLAGRVLGARAAVEGGAGPESAAASVLMKLGL